MPFGTIPQTQPQPGPPVDGSPGSWSVVAKSSDIEKIADKLRTQGTTSSPCRLNRDVIEDIFLVTHYTASTRA
jgi:hypothetical protein